MPFLERRSPFSKLFERAEKACDEAHWSREKMHETADHGRALIVDIEERKKITGRQHVAARTPKSNVADEVVPSDAPTISASTRQRRQSRASRRRCPATSGPSARSTHDLGRF